MPEFITCDNNQLTWEDLVKMLTELVDDMPALRIIAKEEA